MRQFVEAVEQTAWMWLSKEALYRMAFLSDVCTLPEVPLYMETACELEAELLQLRFLSKGCAMEDVWRREITRGLLKVEHTRAFCTAIDDLGFDGVLGRVREQAEALASEQLAQQLARQLRGTPKN